MTVDNCFNWSLLLSFSFFLDSLQLTVGRCKKLSIYFIKKMAKNVQKYAQTKGEFLDV